ncbi:MAG: DUF721 domain-containing protein [Desulfovibrionaceae bacterium]
MYPLFKKDLSDILNMALFCDEDELISQKIPTPTVELTHKLLDLWKNWDTIMGSPIKDILSPVDTRKTTLLLTATNSVALQEAHYYKEDILQKVHSFLGMEYFHSISIRHSLGETPLTKSNSIIYSSEIYAPTVHSIFSDNIVSHNSAIQKAYNAFRKRMKKI